MAVLHDLGCRVCGTTQSDVFVVGGNYPLCCGTAMHWIPAKVTTDVLGCEVYSDAAGRSFTSQRQKERFMAQKGFTVAGDKVGGARKDLSIRGSAFSYLGQGSRVSTGERR